MKLLTSIAAATAALAGLTVATPALPAAAAGTTPACGNADLSVSYRYAGSGAGHAFARIRITNVSDHACHSGGYGGISYVGGGDGTQVGHAAIRERHRAVRTYTLEPGQRLVSVLDRVNAEIYAKKKCRPADVDGLRVYVPNATKSQYVALPTVGCTNRKVHLLFQRPYHRP